MPFYAGFSHSIFLFALLLCFKIVLGAAYQHPLLLIVSLDGLRYDFITPELTPNIWRLAQNGVFAPHGISPQVITVTSPNHQSIATGLYEESHGIIDNMFYDPVLDEFYDNWNFSGNITTAERSRLYHWYVDGGEPIWRTNMQIDGHYSGSLNWPLADAQYVDKYTKKHKFTPWKVYGNFRSWVEEIDKLLAWFTDEKEPINFGLYYNAQPDHVEHVTDVEGPEVKHVILEVDNLIGYLVERLNETNLLSRMNIILTADHGHANVPNATYLFNLRKYLDLSQVVISGPSYFPRKMSLVSEQEIFDNLSRAVEDGVGIRVWKKENFPNEYHYKNNRRVGPVIVMYDLHYWNDPLGSKAAGHFPFGEHGYLTDYDEMRPFFVAHGPAFRKHFHLADRSVQNIDLYPLMCLLLGVKPAPNNGSLERIGVILDPDYARLNGQPPVQLATAPSTIRIFLTFLCLVFPALLLVLIYVGISSVCKRRIFGESPNNNYTLLSQDIDDSNLELNAQSSDELIPSTDNLENKIDPSTNNNTDINARQTWDWDSKEL